MTGATGFLGIWTLSTLLDMSTAQVTCLVRAKSREAGARRIRDTAEAYGVCLPADLPRLTVVCGDLSAERFGLDPSEYQRLAREVDTLLHCGATVDWMKPYGALKAVNVSGTHEMIRFAFTRRKKRLHHVSSLAVLPLDPGTTRYNEEEVASPDALTNGYAQTKWAAEKLCRNAMEMGLPVTIYRFDYVAGTRDVGAMKETDFIVRLIKGCIRLGAIPEEETNFDILAADHLAETLVTLALDPENANLTCHLLNRRPFSTSDFGKVIRDHGYPLERLPYDRWIGRLEEDRENPLFPLTPFIKRFSAEEIEVYASWLLDNTNTLSSLSRRAPELITNSPSAREVVSAVMRWFADRKTLVPPTHKAAMEEQKRYWADRFRGGTPPALLPRIPGGEPGQTVESRMDDALATRLADLADAVGVGEDVLLLTLFGGLLSRLTDTPDVLIRVGTCDPRHFPKHLPLLETFDPEATLEASASHLNAALKDAMAHADMASEDILALHPECEGMADRIPFFVYTCGNDHREEGCHAHLFERAGLGLSANRNEAGITLGFSATSGLVEGVLENLAAAFTRLVSRLVEDPPCRLMEAMALPVTHSDSPPMPIAPSWNARIEQQIEATPDAVAVEFRGESLCYRELGALAGRVAARLRSAGVGAGSVVGVNLARSPLLVATLLALPRLGAVLLPLDPSPDYPEARVTMMVEDANAAFWVTEKEEAAPLATMVGVGLENLGKDELLPGDSPDPDAITYLIYTSGSTGIPKGVRVSHGALTHFLLAMSDRLALEGSHRFLVQTTLTFDIAFAEYLMPLMAGGTLVLLPPALGKDAFGAARFLQEAGLTHMQGTPSFYRMLLLAGWKPDEGTEILCGGEPLSESLASELLDGREGVWNVYGPTETTIWSTMGRVTDPARITIGTALSGNRLHVLDRNMAPMMDGTEGELWIGGPQVAMGYHNREELTAERFVPSPLPEEEGEILYRTGDRVLRSPDGRLHFAGRGDNQLKIRGHRVEPGEIEVLMEREAWIAQAVVVADGDVLRGVVVAKGETGDTGRLREALKKDLPEWMVPASIHVLDAFPKTANNKVDRKNILSRLDVSSFSKGNPPTTPGEIALAKLWEEVLGVRPTCSDSFVALGGDSIGVVRLIALIRTHLGVSLSVQSLFDHITLSAMAELMEAGGRRAEEAHEATIDAMLKDASLGEWTLPENGEGRDDLSGCRTLLLTGATGYLGAFLVDALLEQSRAEIHCLVRAGNDEEALGRVRRNLERYGLWREAMGSRIHGVSGDLGDVRLGLGDRWETYCATMDGVVHNGAVVNFSFPYSLLKGPNVDGTREVLNFCAKSRVKPLVYVSTISVFETTDGEGRGSWSETDPLPEPGGLFYGYSQSKWVAEHLVRQAARKGLPATIFRPGPIYGHSRTGVSNTGDFFTNMIRACSISGEVPMSDVSLDGAPVDFVAESIAAISCQKNTKGGIYHLVNPNPIPLGEVVDYMESYGYSVSRIPFREWLQNNLQWLKKDPLMGQVVPLLAEEGLTGKGKSFFELQVEERPAFFCHNTKAALAEDGCPELDETLFHTYLDSLEKGGYIHGPNGQGFRIK